VSPLGSIPQRPDNALCLTLMRSHAIVSLTVEDSYCDREPLDMKPMKISGVELNWIDRENIKLDRLTLGDLGLKMPRLTKKYWLGVRQLSTTQQTSPFFIHTMAARSGTNAVYKYLEELGFTWTDNNWVKRA
jgi:hypothetical protein